MSTVYNLASPPADAVMHASNAFGKSDWLSCMLHWCLRGSPSVDQKNHLFRCLCELPSDIGELLLEERFSATVKVMVTDEVHAKLKSLMVELKALVGAAGLKHAPMASKPVHGFFPPGLFFSPAPGATVGDGGLIGLGKTIMYLCEFRLRCARWLTLPVGSTRRCPGPRCT